MAVLQKLTFPYLRSLIYLTIFLVSSAVSELRRNRQFFAFLYFGFLFYFIFSFFLFSVFLLLKNLILRLINIFIPLSPEPYLFIYILAFRCHVKLRRNANIISCVDSEINIFHPTSSAILSLYLYPFFLCYFRLKKLLKLFVLLLANTSIYFPAAPQPHLFIYILIFLYILRLTK